MRCNISKVHGTTLDAIEKLKSSVYYIVDGDVTKPNPKLEQLLSDIIDDPKMTTRMLNTIQQLIWEMR